jgi:hypothetical protein
MGAIGLAYGLGWHLHIESLAIGFLAFSVASAKAVYTRASRALAEVRAEGKA